MQPRNPTQKMRPFFQRIHRPGPRLCQLVAVSTRAGAMMAKVDILTAPRRETTRSSHGTVAANATEKKG